MGWLAVIALRPLAEHLSSWGLFWLAAGGLVGLARIVQGRHFASDVLWSAAICATLWALWYAHREKRI